MVHGASVCLSFLMILCVIFLQFYVQLLSLFYIGANSRGVRGSVSSVFFQICYRTNRNRFCNN